VWVDTIMIALYGVMVFVFFGISRRNYDLWKNLIIKGLKQTPLGSKLSTAKSDRSMTIDQASRDDIKLSVEMSDANSKL
jgi:hypothetical protein